MPPVKNKLDIEDQDTVVEKSQKKSQEPDVEQIKHPDGDIVNEEAEGGGDDDDDEQRVEMLNAQRTEKLNHIKLIEKEKDELEGPKNEAMAYIKLQNELSQCKFNLIQVGNKWLVVNM